MDKENDTALTNGPPSLFRNHYYCRHCELHWEDAWFSTSNDRCPNCDRETEPCESEDVEGLE